MEKIAVTLSRQLESHEEESAAVQEYDTLAVG